MELILVVILLFILVGALPSWGYSRSWGYGPSGVVGFLVLLLILWLLFGTDGRVHF